LNNLNYSSYKATIASNFDCATNPHPHPTDFAHEIRIRRRGTAVSELHGLRWSVKDAGKLACWKWVGNRNNELISTRLLRGKVLPGLEWLQQIYKNQSMCGHGEQATI